MPRSIDNAPSMPWHRNLTLWLPGTGGPRVPWVLVGEWRLREHTVTSLPTGWAEAPWKKLGTSKGITVEQGGSGAFKKK